MNTRVFGCGSHAGYVWHLRHDEEVCVFCREAANEYDRQWRARKRKPREPLAPVDWARCGTPQNYAAHRYRGEKPCRACRMAYSRYKADTRAARSEHNGQNEGSLP